MHSRARTDRGAAHPGGLWTAFRVLLELTAVTVYRVVMTKLLAAVLTCIFVAGCGASGPCSKRSGTYRIAYKTRSGNCGEIPEIITTVDDSTVTPAGCTGNLNFSADNCRATLASYTCPTETNGKLKTDGTVDWSRDGRSASGIVQMTLSDAGGSTLCSGSYDLTYTKQ